MPPKISRRIAKGLRNLPNLLHGYNLYVDRDKLRLIDLTLRDVIPGAKSFADLGGVWKVNAAYSIHTMKKFQVDRGTLVDTNFPRGLHERLRHYPRLRVLAGDFGLAQTAEAVGSVDVIYFFDVLLHQANPNWDEVLRMYSKAAPCFVIYNQQFTRGEEAIRLTELPLSEYVRLVPEFRFEVYKYVYDHKTEMHPTYGKPWGDVHNIFQWGITDRALRTAMNNLGYEEVFFANHGRFSELASFENHAFIFMRR